MNKTDDKHGLTEQELLAWDGTVKVLGCIGAHLASSHVPPRARLLFNPCQCTRRRIEDGDRYCAVEGLAGHQSACKHCAKGGAK